MWKNIPGYEGLYSVNENGDVINVRTGYQLKWRIDRHGYPFVDLYKNGKRKLCFIHRLVAMSFIPNPNNYPIVMHKDNNKSNPHVSNLKWGTHAENMMQAYEDGLITIPKNQNVYEIYNDTYGYRTLGYKETTNAIGYGTHTTISNLLMYSTKIKQGTYEGYKIRKAEKTKPFIINR